MPSVSPQKLRVEISAATLSRLLALEQICAAEFRCLDCSSKQCLWKLCLESCACGVYPGKVSRAPANDCDGPCHWRSKNGVCEYSDD